MEKEKIISILYTYKDFINYYIKPYFGNTDIAKLPIITSENKDGIAAKYSFELGTLYIQYSEHYFTIYIYNTESKLMDKKVTEIFKRRTE